MSKKNTSITEEKKETSRRKFIKKAVVAGVAGVAAVTTGKSLEAVKKLKPGTRSFVKIKANERNALLMKLKKSINNRELVLKGMGEKLGGYSDYIDYSDHINEWDAGMKTKIKTREKMK